MITIETDAWGGKFYMVHTGKPASRTELAVEELSDLDRFVCSYREEPFFMSARAGGNVDEIPKETQWLGIRHRDGTFSVYFSMAFEVCRTALYGKNGSIWVVALTGDDQVQTDCFCAFYKISGSDFYILVETAAKALRERFGISLRDEKPAPKFMDLFGWCTWDSFYDQVRAEDIPAGLESFRKGRLVPKLLILDDGWQTTGDKNLARGQWKLSDFAPNEKFGGDLTETVAAAKAMGVEKFFVWHAMLGYWGGVDPTSEAMKKYRPVLSKADHTGEIKEVNPARWESEHFDFGIIDPEQAARFYDDYHASLKKQGVDGVKIDVQASIEGHAQGRGGRIALTRKFRQGLESSVCVHFGGEMINCMSCSNDHLYHCEKTNVMRSSNDFFPDQLESHSGHIYRNAVSSIWMRPFVWCDWDMFQTSHEYGAYHAAARSISGGPVYVSDRVEEHDFSLIRALTDSEGRILRCEDTAVPTVDCLFRDPREARSLYKIFNRNECNAVVGVFSFEGGTQSISVSPADIAAPQGKYALYNYQSGRTMSLDAGEQIEVTLRSREFDIITLAQIRDGFAVLGLKEKLNCGGAVRKLEKTGNSWTMEVRDGGTLLLFCEKEIEKITAGGKPAAFRRCGDFIFADIPAAGTVSMRFL